MRFRGVLSNSVPEPADQVRQTSSPSSVTANGQLPGDRATIFRATSREDSH